MSSLGIVFEIMDIPMISKGSKKHKTNRAASEYPRALKMGMSKKNNEVLRTNTGSLFH